MKPRYLALLASLILLAQMAVATEVPDDDALFGLMETQCRLNQPERFCSCLTTGTKAHLKEKGIGLLEIDETAQQEITLECLLSTGMIRQLMNNASIMCYTQDAQQMHSEQRDIAALQALYPEKKKACSCYQSAVDKMDERTFYEETTAAYNAYIAKVECKKNPGSCTEQDLAQLEKPFTEGTLVEIRNTCGLE